MTRTRLREPFNGTRRAFGERSAKGEFTRSGLATVGASPATNSREFSATGFRPRTKPAVNATEFVSLLEARGLHPVRNGSGWASKCPSHEDGNPSLSVAEGRDGAVLVKCHANCATKDVCAALGCTVGDLFPAREKARPSGNGAPRGRIVATYPYTNEKGELLFEVCRFAPKDFRQRRPDPTAPGGWNWSVKGVRRVLYRLPEVLAAVETGRPIYVVEGEKDVAALVHAGFEATTCPAGAGKWRSEYSDALAGAEVVVLPDADTPGRKHAAQVAQALYGVARSVRVCELPGELNGRPVKDVSDWFAAGGTPEQLRAMADAAPEWTPTPDPRPEGERKPEAGPAQPPATYAPLAARYGAPLFFGEGGTVRGVNERFFAALVHAAGDILFEPSERAFYEYTAATGLWARASEEHVRERVNARLVEYGREVGTPLEARATATRANAVASHLKAIAERRGAFARKGDAIHLANGTVRFSDDGRATLAAFKPEDYSRNRCPIAFDESAECPRFIDSFLRTALPEVDADFLQRWAGLALAGVNPAQRFVILDGAAATGKSTFARIMQLLVGAENCAQLRTELLRERFEFFRFVGKTLLLAPDVPGDFLDRKGASALKALVGGDPLTAEAKGSNEVFSMAGTFNVLITSNSRLRVRLDGDAGAWRRRLVIVRFEKPPPAVRVPNFADKLIADEGPGIVRWALAGFLRARQEIAETGDLALTPEQSARVDGLLQESDSVRRFLAECTEAGDGDVSTVELIEAYYAFCASREWTPQPPRNVNRTFSDAILELHGASQRHDIRRDRKSVRGWRGVELRREPSAPLPEAPELEPEVVYV